ncbi:MAG: LysR family transcriptional regulator, partial [Bacteroidota bacterium]
MDKWTELRTAYHVAKLGTVSAAADALDIHRATVLRHVETLETELGGALFYRHARGYTPTDAGRDLLRVAAATEDQFRLLAGRTRGRAVDVSGELVVTTVDIVAPLILPAIEHFREENPRCTVRLETSERVL